MVEFIPLNNSQRIDNSELEITLKWIVRIQVFGKIHSVSVNGTAEKAGGRAVATCRYSGDAQMSSEKSATAAGNRAEDPSALAHGGVGLVQADKQMVHADAKYTLEL